MGTSVQFHLGEKRSALVHNTIRTTFYTIYPVNSRREVQRKLLYNKEKFFRRRRQTNSNTKFNNHTRAQTHLSRGMRLLAVLSAAALSASVSALPQAPVSANELRQNSAGSNYGEDSGAIDAGVL